MGSMTEIHTLDYHTAGEPLRIVTSGFPPVPGNTMAAKRRHLQGELDRYRRLLMLEPRGHADMYGAVLTEPVSDDADVGVLFMHNEGCSTMCGHGIIALAAAAYERGVFGFRDPTAIRMDTPAGLITASVAQAPGQAPKVTFRNVPSFVLHHGLEIDYGNQNLTTTIAWGGAYYAYVDAAQAGLALAVDQAPALIRAGRQIKAAVNDVFTIEHPGSEPDVGFLYGVIFVENLPQPGRSRNVCIFADGELDRSPTGTGVSGRAAIHHALGELEVGHSLTIESIIGTRFEVRCLGETRVGRHPAVLTEVSGHAFMTGEHRFVLAEHDPLPEGFLMR
jgi:trans-L-3-hydroxyproline dehydratase